MRLDVQKTVLLNNNSELFCDLECGCALYNEDNDTYYCTRYKLLTNETTLCLDYVNLLEVH